MEKRLLNINEMSEYVGISPGSLYVWVSRGRIPHVKIGRKLMFDKRTIDKWIDSKVVKKIYYNEIL